MRIAARILALAALALGLAAPATAQRPQPLDMIIWGGPIYTVDEARPRAEAVGVREGRIAFVGDRRAARALVGPRTQVVDLRGAALFPGFTDSHAHLSGIGERELTLNLQGTASLAALVQAVQARVATTEAGRTVVGRGWIETHWPERRFPTRQDLDAVSPNHPVLLTRADGHALVANSAALRAAGITHATRAPAGGEILRGAAGEPTGVLVDDAMPLVAALRGEVTPEERSERLTRGMEVMARYGWTGVHNMSVHWDDVQILEVFAANGAAPIRVYNAVDAQFADQLFASGPRATPDGRVTTRTIKVYADGALGSRGARLLAPYADAPGARGLERLPANYAELLRRARDRGIQVATHAIGDAANQQVLDAYQAALPTEQLVTSGRPRRYISGRVHSSGRPPVTIGDQPGQFRWRVEHSQHLGAPDIARFANLGVIASMQPSHAIGDLHFAPARLGQERLSGAYAWSALLRSGATVIFGSDAPVERGDPLIEFYAAVARRDLQGFTGPGWHPEQAVTREQALRAFTRDAAYARFAEDEIGAITVGRRADFSVFSVDLMTAPLETIPRGHALLTIVDGQIVYRRDGW